METEIDESNTNDIINNLSTEELLEYLNKLNEIITFLNENIIKEEEAE